MHIGILLCGHPPETVSARHGDFSAIFAKLFEGQGLSFESWDVEAMAFPESIDAAEGWLLTGSRHGAYEDHPFIAPLSAFIEAVHAAKKPMVGICFGHQIIAQALGGRVEKYSGGWALGRQVYDYAGAEIALNAWHQDQVVARPPEARQLASSAFCENAALVYGDHLMTLQPHPEISDEILRDYLVARRGDPAYPPDIFDQASAQLGLPVDNAAIAARLARFLKDARPS
ncbi:MAG: type 1 glutamine amidotransferase [Pseudomonadota bacterium]